MNKQNTILEIENIITDITDMIYPCLTDLRKSEHVYTPSVDNYIEHLNTVINGLEDMRNDLAGEVR